MPAEVLKPRGLKQNQESSGVQKYGKIKPVYTIVMEMPEHNGEKQAETIITPENFESVSKRLGTLIWGGDYKEALPIADQILEFKSKQGESEREAALIRYASNYYSAAS